MDRAFVVVRYAFIEAAFTFVRAAIYKKKNRMLLYDSIFIDT